MRKTFSLFLVAVLLAGCGASAGQGSTSLKVTAPWTLAERASYSIDVAGKPAGTLVFTITPKDNGFVMVTETTTGAVKNVTQATVDKNLNPVSDTAQLTGAGKADYTLVKTYSKGKLSFQAKTADGDKTVSVDYPAGTWDNDQSLMSVSGLPLAEGYSQTVTLFSGTTTPIKTQIKVIGKEQVTVPAGTYTAYNVEFDFGGQAKANAWYDVNKPYFMVKYTRPEGPQTIVLTKIGTP